MHPLKNLNIWGDGGFIITQNEKIAKKLCLLRNHGLVDRNICKIFGFNSRLDTIQAVVANYKMKNKLKNITIKRIKNAVAGQADVILVPNVEAGNALVKIMIYFMGACAAGVVVGGKVPVVITSRSDDAPARLASIAAAVVALN